MPAKTLAHFIDTNILIYLASGDDAKAARAEEILREGGVVSVQVLNELTNVARRKLRMDWPDIRAFLGLLRGLVEVQPITMDTHEAGLVLAERYGLSTYDAMIVASAAGAGCAVLWSEDMQHGMAMGETLRVVNPFRPASFP